MQRAATLNLGNYYSLRPHDLCITHCSPLSRGRSPADDVDEHAAEEDDDDDEMPWGADERSKAYCITCVNCDVMCKAFAVTIATVGLITSIVYIGTMS